MQYVKSLLNIGLGAVGGILGNLVASWIVQDLWSNFFTPARIVGAIFGFVLVILLLAWWDATTTSQGTTKQRPTGVANNVQIGNPIIRVLKGTNIYGNWQIGSGTIEVIESNKPSIKRTSQSKKSTNQ